MKAKSKNVKTWRRFERFVEIVADAGSIAMDLRDKPNRLDWLGVGLRAVGLAMRVRSEHREANSKWPWRFFESEGADPEWIEAPAVLKALVLEHVTDIEIRQDYWDGCHDSVRVVVGNIGGEAVAWIEDDDSVQDGPYLRGDRAAETYRALGDRMWKQLGGGNCAFGRDGLAPDPFSGDEGVVPTEQFQALRDRMGRFLGAGMARSYMLVGPPGTGKSSGVRWLMSDLELCTLRIDLSAFSKRPARGEQSVAASLEALLQILRPEALVLDDIDRAEVNGELLQFLELAHRTCRVVVATANCTENMLGAALRPGRFDEVHKVDRLDAAVLAQLLGADRDLADKLTELPVAYVTEFVKRRQVLGRTVAEAELTELLGRCAAINERTEDGD